jgi:hypothetical protein
MREARPEEFLANARARMADPVQSSEEDAEAAAQRALNDPKPEARGRVSLRLLKRCRLRRNRGCGTRAVTSGCPRRETRAAQSKNQALGSCPRQPKLETRRFEAPIDIRNWTDEEARFPMRTTADARFLSYLLAFRASDEIG